LHDGRLTNRLERSAGRASELLLLERGADPNARSTVRTSSATWGDQEKERMHEFHDVTVHWSLPADSAT
jgi:hypothetical protein